MTRAPRLVPDDLDDAQRTVYGDIVWGPRAAAPGGFPFRRADGSLTGPFGLMLIDPGAGGPLQELGAHLRYAGTLPDAVREAVVLLVAGTWDCAFERAAHGPLARKAGVSDAQVDALGAGRLPDGLPDDVMLATGAVAELLRDRALSDSTHAAMRARFGDRGLLEVVVLAGYYGTLAMMLNAFAVLPEDGA